MQFKPRALCFLPVILFGLFAAACSEVQADHDELFQQLDANSDGQIEPSEIPQEHSRLFKRLVRTSDHDGDGQLSPEEFAESLTPTVPEKPLLKKQSSDFPGTNALLLLLVRMDTNADGVITRTEIPKRFDALFTRIEDRLGGEHDGRLVREEMVQAAPALSRIAKGVADEMGIDVELELALLPKKKWELVQRMLSPENRAELLAEPQEAKKLFRRLDANDDGQIEASEIPNGFVDRFDRLMRRADVNQDDMLSEQELLDLSERLRRMNANRLPPEEVKKQVNNLLDIFDSDGDGMLTRKEAPSEAQRGFGRIDRDGNGRLDRQELGQVVELMTRLRGPAGDFPARKPSPQRNSQ